MTNATSEETSADWADRLQLFDAGQFDALEQSKRSAIQKSLSNQKHKEQQEQQQNTQQSGQTKHQKKPFAHVSAPTTQTTATETREEEEEEEEVNIKVLTLDPSPLTLRVRRRLRENDNTMGKPSETTCALLVRQVSPSLLSKLYTQTNSPHAVLVAYFDACPYSRATEDGLVSLAKRMHRRNLSLVAQPSNSRRDFCIMMYDVRAKGNRTFAKEKLRASPVPKLYTVVPQSRAIVPWTGEPLGEVRPSATSREWTRTLPEDALFDALRNM